MSSRYCHSLKTSRLLFILGLLLVGPVVHGEEKKVDEVPWEDLVRIRLWNMCPPPASKLRIVLERDKEQLPVNLEANWLESTGYCTVMPKKSFTIVVEDASNGKEVGKVQFKADKGQYFTIMAKLGTDGTEVSVIDDTFSYVPNMPGRVTFYLFAPGYQAKVGVLGEVAKDVPYGNSVAFENLPEKAQLHLQVTRLKDGKTLERNVDMEFKDAKHKVCFLTLDRRERFALRTVAQGYVFAVIESEPAPEAIAPTP